VAHFTAVARTMGIPGTPDRAVWRVISHPDMRFISPHAQLNIEEGKKDRLTEKVKNDLSDVPLLRERCAMRGL
jgi:hypothetical protein